MMRLLVCAFVGVSVLAALPHYASEFEKRLESRQERRAEANEAQSRAAVQALVAHPEESRRSSSYASGRSMRIAPDTQGHFIGDFRINGRQIDGLIDTGATYVALNRSNARKLGVNPTNGDFTFRVNTANGQTKAAKVLLDRLDIGPIRVRDVEAFVLDDGDLDITLIGMSFMNKLDSFSVENGELLLIE